MNKKIEIAKKMQPSLEVKKPTLEVTRPTLEVTKRVQKKPNFNNVA